MMMSERTRTRFRRLRRAGLLAMLSLTGLSEVSQARWLPPWDECGTDPSFRAFRAKLLKAIDRKDKRYLLSIISPDITVTFGPGGEGRAAFVNEWELDRGARSRVWAELKAVLALGCARDPEGMTAPYLFSRLPDDPDLVVVVKPDTILRAEPGRTASIVAELPPWEILTRTWPDTKEGWFDVRRSGGQSGYVEARAVRSPIDHRAGFEKINGCWRMTAFVAGD